MAFCSECGANVPDDLRYCTGCGKAMSTAPVQQQSASVQTANTATPTITAPAYPPQAQPTFQSGANAAPPKGSKYAVMSTLSYIGTLLLFMVPIVGLIFCIKWSFSGTVNLNRRNLSRAYLIFTAIAVALGIISFILLSTLLNSLWDYMREVTDGQLGNWKDIFDGLGNLPTN